MADLTPREDYQSFDECVAWHSQVTIASTAAEICALEYGFGGDTVDVDDTKPDTDASKA